MIKRLLSKYRTYRFNKLWREACEKQEYWNI